MKQPDLIAPAVENYEKTQSLASFADDMKELINPGEDDSSSDDEVRDKTQQGAELVYIYLC
jgi:hypothetical protein